MFEKLAHLLQKGYYPDTILDIGAHHGNWTSAVKNIFGYSRYYLFEGIDYVELTRFHHDPSVSIHNVILNDKIDTVNWYQMKNSGDSIFREKTHHFENCQVIQRETVDLNTYISQTGLLRDAANILIKVDCQGAELPILRGATHILSKTGFIILEMPLFGQYNEGVPTFLEHISEMDRLGFVPYDIIDNHYINGYNMQIDMLFINKNHPFNTTVNELLLVRP
jgi:FkbM family methyltransferase